MFYSVHVLGKKGPLARVWLAAHWDKKITKAQILETNIVESVDSILQPRVKLSLRTSSHLLLGIVRIYARKTAYLLQDCQEAAFKIKSAFRPGAVDLPDGKTEAAIAAITLPETFDFDLIAEPPMQIEPVQSNANIRNITLSDDVVSINIDDDLYINEVQNNWSDLSSLNPNSINASSSKHDITLTNKDNSLWQMYDRPIDGDGFGGSFNDVDDLFALPVPPEMQELKQPEYQKNPIESGTLLDDHDLDHLENGKDLINNDMPFDDRPMSRMSVDSDMSYGAPPSLAPSSPGSLGNDLDDTLLPQHNQNDTNNHYNDQDKEELRQDENSLFNKNANNLDSLVLEPIEQGLALERRKKRRKKLGIIIDEIKTLSGEEMKSQLSHTKDIIAELDLAPPSKKLMYLKRTANIEKLFGNPIIELPSTVISIYFIQNLKTSKVDSEQQDYPDHYLNGSINDESEFRRPTDPLPELDEDYNQSFVPPASPLREIQQPKTPRTLRKEQQIQEKSSKKKRKLNDSAEKQDKPNKTPKLDASERFANSQYIINESSDMERMRRDTSNFNNITTGESMYIQQDDDFDYEQPMSVGPAEEMMPEETAEQFEERMRNKRTNVLLRLMANQLDEDGFINFSNLVKGNRRKQVAQKFYSLLVLKKQQAIELLQDNSIPYAELTVNKGYRYDDALVASTV